MADQPTTPHGSPSGSRWEPEPDETPTEDSLNGAAAAAPVPPLDYPVAEERRARLRSRAVLAGAATAFALGGGLTGFVIGHATAGGDDLRPANFARQGPGGRLDQGQLGPGQQDQGQQGQFGQGQQGPPSFRDHDGDGYAGPGDVDGDSDDDGNSSGSSANPT